MQIILMEKVANLGNLGDVVKVKDGFARNYLIPHGMAKRVTPDNLAVFEAKRAELEKVQAERLSDAKALAEKIDGATVQVTRKASVDGRLFGSVSTADITEALQALGHTALEKSMVRLPQGPLKQVGDEHVQIALHGDVVVTVTVSVLGEQ